MKVLNYCVILCIPLLFSFCDSKKEKSAEEMSPDKLKLMTLDPGHFHAALVQKKMYENVDSVVYVYAPESKDVELHIDRIRGFNTRKEDPTHWMVRDPLRTCRTIWIKRTAILLGICMRRPCHGAPSR